MVYEKDKYTQPQKVPQEDISWFVAVVVVVVVIRSHTGNKVLQRKQITSPSNECRNIPFVTEIGRKITKIKPFLTFNMYVTERSDNCH